MTELSAPGHRRRSGWRTAVCGIAIAGIAVTLASCSSSGSKTSTTSTPSAAGGSASASSGASDSTAACVTKADAAVAPYLKLPTALPAGYTPLSKPPKPGGTVIQLAGPIPSDRAAFAGLQVAAKAIGWKAKSISYNGSVEDLNAKFMQAVADKPTAIGVGGQPVAAISKPIAAAKAAGIIVVLDSVADQPTTPTGYAVSISGLVTISKIATIDAYQFMADSKCTGSAAVFNLPIPILQSGIKVFQDTVTANCPKCKVTVNYLQVNAVGTPAATTAMVSKLQSSPDTKYAFTVIANLATGLPTALNQAGIKGVKIFGNLPDAGAIAGLRDKTNAWWVAESTGITPWAILNGVLQVLDTGKAQPDTGVYPINILTPDNITSAGGALPTYPLDYEQEFIKLWTGK